MEYGETPRRCARRELLEETGIAARLTGLFGVYAGRDDPRARAVLILYTGVRVGGRLKPGDDALEARFFPLEQPPRRIAFASHRQALEELRAASSRPGASATPRRRIGVTRPARRASSP